MEEESLYKISLDTDGKEVELSKKEVYNKEYKYVSNSPNRTSELVSEIKYTGAYNNTIHYGYDGNKRIFEVNDIYYTYDKAGHLTTEVNVITRTGENFVYDKGGNVVEVRPFLKGRYCQSQTFTYGDSNWKDLLTEYNGNEITYDEIGNPLTYYDGTKFSWTMGRRLESVRKGNARISYKYNADGLRTSKTINGIKFSYFWNGDKLTAQTWLGNTIYFYYDNNGVPIGFDYNYNHYYYVTNLQGDIIAILSSDGDLVAEYTYDAWGNYTIVTNKDSIANINPLRYRGYYFDSDTNLYYLQSRYYDSKTGRFINADEAMFIGMNGGMVSNNLFAYCDNNPVNKKDANGHIAANIVGAVIAGIVGAVGGYFLTNWLADRLGLSRWKRKLFVWGLSAVITAAAATIGYFVGPYVAKAWNWLSAKLVGLLKGAYRTIGKIEATKMKYKINVSKHLWTKVLGKKVTTTGIENLIYQTIRKGTWKIMDNGTVRIIWT